MQPETLLAFLEGPFVCELDENICACFLIPASQSALPDFPDGISRLKRAISGLQARRIAVLLDDPSLADRCRADGAHVTLDSMDAGVSRPDSDSLSPLALACNTLKPGGIVGVGGLTTRHAAMSAGESDIDYVLFGEPGPAGDTPGLAAVEERTAWWSEIFNIPCVAYAPDAGAISALAAAGADFVAVDAQLFATLNEPMELLRSEAANMVAETAADPATRG